MKSRIKSYLISGLKPADICSILGCSAGYISQLLKDDTFKEEVSREMANNPPPSEARLENKYEALEHRIVETMQAEATGADLNTLSKALDSITRARDARHKRTLPFGGQALTLVQQNITSVSLPSHALAAPSIILNEQSEVIAIDNKPMAPLTSDGVKHLFKDLSARRAVNELQEISYDTQSPTNTSAAESSAF